MEIFTLIPCAAGLVAWEQQPGDLRTTVVAKRTFGLDRSFALASSQEPLYDDDRISSAGAMYRPSDLAPFKKNVDCVVVGSAYAGTGEPFTELEVGLRLGTWIHKRLRVTTTGPTRRVALSYEHAPGGPGTPNPLGWADAGGRNGHGVRISAVAAGTSDEPIGMAPIPASWPSRVAQNPTRWAPMTAHDLGVVGHVSPTFFQCGPSDQQTPQVAPGDYLELLHLLPGDARLILALPALAPTLMVFEDGQEMTALAMRCDLLVVDTDRQVMTATSRVTMLRSSAQTTVVVGSAQHVAMELGEISAALNHADGARRLRSWLTSCWVKRAAPPPAPQKRAITEPSASAQQRGRRLTARLLDAPRPDQPAWLTDGATRAGPPPELPPPAPWASSPAPPVHVEQSSTMVIDLAGTVDVPSPALPPPPAPPAPAAAPPPLPAPPAKASVPPPPARAPTPPPFPGPAPQAAGSEPRRDAQLPSYLKQMAEPPQRAAPMEVAHDAGAVHVSGAAGASDAAVAPASSVSAPRPSEAPAPASSVAAILFVDERELSESSAREELGELAPVTPALVDEASADALDWVQSSANEETPMDVLVERALLEGRATPLAEVGFRLEGSEARLLRAPLLRVEGSFAPVLSKVRVLRAELRIAALALTPLEPDRATGLRALLELLTDDLESAPSEVFAPVEDELTRACDGDERRPFLSDVTRAAERTVMRQRGLARVDGPSGSFVIGELSGGGTRTRLLVPEAFAPSLPTEPRWHAVVLARPAPPTDGRSVALQAVVVGQRFDPTSLVLQTS